MSEEKLTVLKYELWKNLAHQYEKKKDDERVCDILSIWESVFEDISKHGLTPESKFTDGWICPIFKKKDPREITNYRPITLLNTDYKILTKSITNRVAKYAPKVIHPDQAGFTTEQQIEDQTELAHLIIRKCEEKEENGMIVCLNQEKADNKILHKFL